MKKTYLLQRGTIEDRDYKTGFDSIVNLGYMGAAEYEFGAIHESLQRIRKNVNNFTYLDVPIFGKTITVFCDDSQKSEIKVLLTKLGNGEINTKGVSYFNHYVNPSEHDISWQKKHPLEVDFWWDLDNDIMFWRKYPEFEVKFKKIISVTPNMAS
jgi:hypothetical protein